MVNCEECVYYDYDAEENYYYCMMDLDEDEMERFLSYNTADCPYYKFGDEYDLSRRQQS